MAWHLGWRCSNAAFLYLNGRRMAAGPCWQAWTWGRRDDSHTLRFPVALVRPPSGVSQPGLAMLIDDSVSWYACYWGARRAAGVRNAARETCDGLR